MFNLNNAYAILYFYTHYIVCGKPPRAIFILNGYVSNMFHLDISNNFKKNEMIIK